MLQYNNHFDNIDGKVKENQTVECPEYFPITHFVLADQFIKTTIIKNINYERMVMKYLKISYGQKRRQINIIPMQLTSYVHIYSPIHKQEVVICLSRKFVKQEYWKSLNQKC